MNVNEVKKIADGMGLPVNAFTITSPVGAQTKFFYRETAQRFADHLQASDDSAKFTVEETADKMFVVAEYDNEDGGFNGFH